MAGLYGIQLGGSVLRRIHVQPQRDASKVAMARLVQECRGRDIRLIDCQVASSEHLSSLGAREVSRRAFLGLLRRLAHRTADRELGGNGGAESAIFTG